MPDELRRNGGKTFVRVEIEVSAEGRTEVRLLTTSGSPELDAKIQEALSRWQWEPAIQEGQPMASKERFKLEFEVSD
jgi:TonB family protein